MASASTSSGRARRAAGRGPTTSTEAATGEGGHRHPRSPSPRRRRGRTGARAPGTGPRPGCGRRGRPGRGRLEVARRGRRGGPEVRPHLAVEVGAVHDRARRGAGPCRPAWPSGGDREVRRLLRHDAPAPDRVVTARAGRATHPCRRRWAPASSTAPTGAHIAAVARGDTALRGGRCVGRPTSRGRTRATASRRRVQRRAEQRHRQQARHRDRQVVQRVGEWTRSNSSSVGHELEHQRLGRAWCAARKAVRRHRHVGSGRPARLDVEIQLADLHPRDAARWAVRTGRPRGHDGRATGPDTR